VGFSSQPLGSWQSRSLLSPSLETITQAHSRNHPKPSTAGSVTNIHHQPHEKDTLQRTETIHLYMELWNKPKEIPRVPLALNKTTLMQNSCFLTSEGMWTHTLTTTTRRPLNWQHDLRITPQHRKRRQKNEGRKSAPSKTINNKAILLITNITTNYKNKNARKDKKQQHTNNSILTTKTFLRFRKKLHL